MILMPKEGKKVSLWQRFMQAKKRAAKAVFFLLVLFVVFNVTVMTLYLANGQARYRVFNHTYFSAIPQGQDLGGTMRTSIVRMQRADLIDLEIGDDVVVCCDFNIPDTPWVQTITGIDVNENAIQTTYDGVILSSFAESQVHGVYVEEASVIGTLYYAASFATGYVFLLMGHLLIVGAYYYVFIMGDMTRFSPARQRAKARDYQGE